MALSTAEAEYMSLSAAVQEAIYLRKILKDLMIIQEEPTNIKIFVSDPGTMKAETCIVYCKVGEEEDDDILMDIKLLQQYCSDIRAHCMSGHCEYGRMFKDPHVYSDRLR